MKLHQCLQQFSALLLLLFFGTSSAYAQRTDLEEYCLDKARANPSVSGYYTSCMANIEADRKYLQRQQEKVDDKRRHEKDIAQLRASLNYHSATADLNQRAREASTPNQKLLVWKDYEAHVSGNCRGVNKPDECDEEMRKIRSELLECAECAFPKIISTAERERLKRESERCIGTGCPALPTVAECAGWLGAFMLADSEIFNRKEKGVKSSAGAKPQGEATASVSNHPMVGQVKALAEKFGGENIQITINQKIKPEIQKLFPQIAADFPEKSVSEQAFIGLRLIKEKAVAICETAGETGIRFVSIANPTSSIASGGTEGKSSTSNPTRQINRKQARDILMKGLKSDPKYSGGNSSVKGFTECVVDIFINSAFPKGVNLIAESSLQNPLSARSGEWAAKELEACSMAAMPPEVQKTNFNLMPMSTDDFRLDYSSFKGKKVRVEGEVMFALNIFTLKKNNMDMSPIPIDVSTLPRQEQKKILEECAAITSECKGVVFGAPGRVLNQNGIIVESIQWKK